MTINWQPIATAPLDGTDVLVYDGYDVWKAYAEYDTWGIKKKYVWFCDSVSDNEIHRLALFHEPTHWLPISDLLQPLGYTP